MLAIDLSRRFWSQGECCFVGLFQGGHGLRTLRECVIDQACGCCRGAQRSGLLRIFGYGLMRLRVVQVRFELSHVRNAGVFCGLQQALPPDIGMAAFGGYGENRLIELSELARGVWPGFSGPCTRGARPRAWPGTPVFNC